MVKRIVRSGMFVLAVALALTPASSGAIAPMLLVMIKQIAQQVAKSMIKDTLLSSLSGMGCKGIALSNALAVFDLRSAAGGAGGMLGGIPKLPAGMTMPSLPAGMSMPHMPAGAALAMGGMPQGAGIPADVAAKMRAMMSSGDQILPNMAMDADQMAMMAGMQQAMSQPLSPPETLATIDELFKLGFLPKAIQSELKECMVLVPAAIPVLGMGMGMGMFKPMIPQLRQARAELHVLSPAEQDEVAAQLLQEMKSLPADELAALMEHLDSGFFPPRVSKGVKAGL
ncbi:MAG: hypothetical protein ABIP64_01470 [Burkholderiales bacterium]